MSFVLEIDHIVPVSQGGDDDLSNLTTSCYECNRGKAAKVLGAAIEPHDLDLDYLEAEQRLAELRQYRQVKKELDELLGETISDLQDFFLQQLSTRWVPEPRAFRWLLYYHEPDEIEKAITLADGQSKFNSSSQKWRYACAILRNWRRGEDYA